MNYINKGKNEGATVHLGGERHGAEGFFIQPTIFTDTKPEMTILKEEIFGPVVAVAKFSDEEDLIKTANDTIYGLAAGVFTKDVSRAITTANRLKAGTIWVNCYNLLETNVPFGGYKRELSSTNLFLRVLAVTDDDLGLVESGIGRELGEYALANYTEVKAVHINLNAPPPI